ncbi:unnamed protein product, partial [Allacma fusca]
MFLPILLLLIVQAIF